VGDQWISISQLAKFIANAEQIVVHNLRSFGKAGFVLGRLKTVLPLLPAELKRTKVKLAAQML
jgi:hypothetical protein